MTQSPLTLHLHPSLATDPRAQRAPLQKRTIFETFLYRISVALHAPESPDRAHHLLSAHLEFLQEASVVVMRLADFEQAPAWSEVTALLKRLETDDGRGPYPLLREAKLALNLPFTLNDRAAFRLVGLDLPRPPKSFWEDPA